MASRRLLTSTVQSRFSRLSRRRRCGDDVLSHHMSTTTTAAPTSLRSGSSSIRLLSSVQPIEDDYDTYEWHERAATKQESDTSHNEENKTAAWVTSPATLSYTGSTPMPISSTLNMHVPSDDTPRGIWPVFRIMDENGLFRDPAWDGKKESSTVLSPLSFHKDTRTTGKDLEELRSLLSDIYPYHEEEFSQSALLHPAKFPYADTQCDNTLLRAHRQMIRLREMDDILLNAQRQGRISFYLTSRGEEAIHMGAGSALEVGDPIFAQYREQGLLMWRGFTLDQFTNQCFGTDLDLGKGRQMPVHYGSRALNYHTVSSPLGTQLPHSVGAAYRLKLASKPNVAVCFFGEGASSTVDFHSALNFAATLKAPVIFFCRNNGYAISTPSTEQFAGDGVVSRAPGYGMAAIRVDGNDIFAVHAAVRSAKAYALEHSAPVLIEAMTYRLGHHSTSDDSTTYRSAEEVRDCEERFDPVLRLHSFLQHHGWLTDEEAMAIRKEERKAVLGALERAENRPPPCLSTLFEDVYHDMPVHLQRQKRQLEEHLKKYGEHYA